MQETRPEQTRAFSYDINEAITAADARHNLLMNTVYAANNRMATKAAIPAPSTTPFRSAVNLTAGMRSR